MLPTFVPRDFHLSIAFDAALKRYWFAVSDGFVDKWQRYMRRWFHIVLYTTINILCQDCGNIFEI